MTRQDPDLSVYYDSACPLCRREVALYRRLDRARRVRWIDLHARAGDPASRGISRERALRRLHAVGSDGRVVSGARAFAAVWRRVPGLRVLGRLLGAPPFVWLAEGLYRLFLLVRPGLSRALARLELERAGR